MPVSMRFSIPAPNPMMTFVSNPHASPADRKGPGAHATSSGYRLSFGRTRATRFVDGAAVNVDVVDAGCGALPLAVRAIAAATTAPLNTNQDRRRARGRMVLRCVVRTTAAGTRS